MKKKYLIYLTTNLINGKKYIGSHITEDIDDSYLGSGVYLKKAIKKYGKINFKKEILAEVENINQMKELEVYYINYYHAVFSTIFYNATKHVAGISTFPKDKIDIIRKANIGNLYNLGKTHSDETKASISTANKGKKKPPSFSIKCQKRMKNNKYALGYKFTEEQKQNISKAKIGQKYPKIHGERISDKNSKAILQYSLLGEFIKEWKSATEVGLLLNKNPSAISECCNKKRKTAYKFIWKFKILN
jgi:group I intron endonuclease